MSRSQFYDVYQSTFVGSTIATLSIHRYIIIFIFRSFHFRCFISRHLCWISFKVSLHSVLNEFVTSLKYVVTKIEKSIEIIAYYYQYHKHIFNIIVFVLPNHRSHSRFYFGNERITWEIFDNNYRHWKLLLNLFGSRT